MLPRDLPEREPALWTAATRATFLDGVRDGTLPAAALDAWLAQDALFVADLLAVQARLVARAPRSAQAVLAGGVVALVEELAWFDVLAQRRGLDLDVPAAPATRDYAALLQRLDAAPYADAVAALWVVERVYLDAWTSAQPGAAPYRELVEHWTVPGFAAYVADLEALTGAVADADLLRDVLRAEAAFWPVPAAGVGAP